MLHSKFAYLGQKFTINHCDVWYTWNRIKLLRSDRDLVNQSKWMHIAQEAYVTVQVVFAKD